MCEFVSLSFSEVSWGDRGPVVSHHWWAIPFSSSSSSFSMRSRGPALRFQCPCHPCCLLTHSLPARRHEARRPHLLLLRRLWKGGRVWARETAELPETLVSLFVLLFGFCSRSSILVLNGRWKEASLHYTLWYKYNFQHSPNNLICLSPQPSVSQEGLWVFCCESAVQRALAEHASQPQLQWPDNREKHWLWAGCTCRDRQWEVCPSPYHSATRAWGHFPQEVGWKALYSFW